MAEQIAVVNACAPAEAPHRIAHLQIDERVHDNGGVAARAADGTLEIVDGLRTWMSHLFELLLGKLSFERLHEASRRFTGGIRDDVKLDRRWHPRAE
jgi:hypothetical protein